MAGKRPLNRFMNRKLIVGGHKEQEEEPRFYLIFPIDVSVVKSYTAYYTIFRLYTDCCFLNPPP